MNINLYILELMIFFLNWLHFFLKKLSIDDYPGLVILLYFPLFCLDACGSIYLVSGYVTGIGVGSS